MSSAKKIVDLVSDVDGTQPQQPATSTLDKIKVTGGQPLNGVIPISGAKNCALKLMCASLLSEESLSAPDRMLVRRSADRVSRVYS